MATETIACWSGDRVPEVNGYYLVLMLLLKLSTTGADPELLGGAPIPKGGHLPNILVIFSEKPYEIKYILVHSGRGMPGAPSKSATEQGRFLCAIHYAVEMFMNN